MLELDIEHIDHILANELQVCVTVRSCRLKKPDNTIASALTNHADTYIDNMMCPPPPSQARISNRIIDDLIVPAPSWGKLSVYVWSCHSFGIKGGWLSNFLIENLYNVSLVLVYYATKRTVYFLIADYIIDEYFYILHFYFNICIYEISNSIHFVSSRTNY